MSNEPGQGSSQRESGPLEQLEPGSGDSTSGQGAASALARMKSQYERHAGQRPVEEPESAGKQHEAE